MEALRSSIRNPMEDWGSSKTRKLEHQGSRGWGSRWDVGTCE
jgi:hypothetical protein